MSTQQNVVIVGAGPAGLLLAHYLLRRHYRVEVYDRRPDPRGMQADQRRSFPISLQERGRKALRSIPGLEEAIAAQGVFCQGTVVHKKDKLRDIKRKNVVLTVDRNWLVLALLEQLVASFDDTVLKLQFDCVCERLDAEPQSVSFLTGDNYRFEVNYDYLVGADGSRSQVREQLVEQYGLGCEQEFVPDAYKSLFLSRTHPEQQIDLAPDRIHTSNLGRDSRMVLAPQPGDRLHGAFIFNPEQNPLEGFNTKEEVFDYFEQNLPTFRPLMSDEEAEALLARPVARLVTVRCDRFHHGDRILLVGDAAHAVSPSIGQGCNSALEDIQIIDQLLDDCQDDWGQMVAQFSQQRVADAHALRDLSDYSFPRTKLLVVEFFLRLTLGRKLNNWFPQWFSPFVFDLVLDTDLSYSEVLRLSQGWINKVKRSMG